MCFDWVGRKFWPILVHTVEAERVVVLHVSIIHAAFLKSLLSVRWCDFKCLKVDVGRVDKLLSILRLVNRAHEVLDVLLASRPFVAAALSTCGDDRGQVRHTLGHLTWIHPAHVDDVDRRDGSTKFVGILTHRLATVNVQ